LAYFLKSGLRLSFSALTPSRDSSVSSYSFSAYMPMPAMPLWCAVSQLKLRLAIAMAVGLRSQIVSAPSCTVASSCSCGTQTLARPMATASAPE